MKWKNFSKTQAVKVNKEEREETNNLFSSKLNILSQNKPSHNELNYPAPQKPHKNYSKPYGFTVEF